MTTIGRYSMPAGGAAARRAVRPPGYRWTAHRAPSTHAAWQNYWTKQQPGRANPTTDCVNKDPEMWLEGRR